jgi:hypothetical protein
MVKKTAVTRGNPSQASPHFSGITGEYRGLVEVENLELWSVTSDAGLVLVRESDERLGREAIIAEHWSDSRNGLNT